MDTIEEMSGKIIIWSRFRYDGKITVMLESKYGPDLRLVTLVTRQMLTDKVPSKPFSLETQDSSWQIHRQRVMG